MALIATTTLTSACQGSGSPSATSTPTSTVGTTTSTSSTTSTSVPTSVAPPPTRSVDWFDLDVGDCLADPPPVDDPNVIAVTLVDCATPHRAEVFRREPLAVDTAIADVAGRKCDDGFTAYTGEPVGSGTFSITYLIDSNQNRTSSNPDPSTVICLLQAAAGGELTAPARR